MTRTRREISNSEDIVDSRDIIKRLEELESERESLVDAVEDAKTALDEYTGDDQDERQELVDAVAEAYKALNEFDGSECEPTEEGQEYKVLKALAEECEGYASDWTYGEALIRDSYFEDYAEQLADDIGAIKSDAGWPLNCIDWKEAAEQLQQDYTSVDWDGVTYWIRSC